ncbi:hypothetical protein LTR37_012042 [Vermiconidia calcicola]|uniref:Uncharacterized protein n=1 Tax=Vermiconidia calcicola TaxID=1690605 RepID=A0ACC3N0A3_9PEZI|nr:hypothetical protein LTR37_012042 [Vermiconidia calcicola]
MVDFGSWVGSLALKVWEPSSSGKGLPFGSYLHSSPPRRQRTLTGPFDPAGESFWHMVQVYSTIEPEQHTDPQAQCKFLHKLPLDIRRIIYDMVLGGMVFHVTTNDSKTRIFSYICRLPEHINDENHIDCFAVSTRRPSSAPRDDYKHATGLLPLLVSCRRIYSEAIETLYSANTFEFWENRVAFGFLKVMVPPQRLRCIRRFRWDMQIPHHPNLNARSRRDWSDLFTFFTNDMCGLQHLHLKFNRSHRFESGIIQTKDEDASGWARPMIVMAIDAKRKRGCHVEVVTNGVVHEPDSIFKAIAHERITETFDMILEMACIELHRRIRLSLDSPG